MSNSTEPARRPAGRPGFLPRPALLAAVLALSGVGGVAGCQAASPTSGTPEAPGTAATATSAGLAEATADLAATQAARSTGLAEYEEVATTTRSPDVRREVLVIRSGDGRDLRVSLDGARARSIGPVAMTALMDAAAAQGGPLSTVEILPLDWESPLRLRLRLVGWVAGREPANLPPVEVTLDVESGLVYPAAP